MATATALLPPPARVDAVDEPPSEALRAVLGTIPWAESAQGLAAAPLWRELDVLERAMAHNGAQQRRSRAFACLRGVRRYLRALHRADASGTWARVRAACDGHGGTSPSAEALAEASIHLGAAARLALDCRREVARATEANAAAVARGHFMNLYVVVLAALCTARVALLGYAKACCLAHNRLSAAAPLAPSRLRNPPPRDPRPPRVLTVDTRKVGEPRVAVTRGAKSVGVGDCAASRRGDSKVGVADDEEDLGEAVAGGVRDFIPLVGGLGVWMDGGGKSDGAQAAADAAAACEDGGKDDEAPTTATPAARAFLDLLHGL